MGLGDPVGVEFHIDVGLSAGQDAARERARRLGGIELPMLADSHVLPIPPATRSAVSVGHDIGDCAGLAA